MSAAPASSSSRPPPPQGVWVAWVYGGIHCWQLHCGEVFHADIRRNGAKGMAFATINEKSAGKDEDIEALMRRVEKEIVRRVRTMLPGYRLVHVRATGKLALVETKTG